MDVQALLNGIKEHARPTYSPRVDEIAATAETNGWTAETLAHTLNASIGANTGTGFVIVNAARLSKTVKQTQTTQTPNPVRGHIKCTKHPEDTCETCYCDPKHPVHHKTVPMPEWFKKAQANGGTSEAFQNELQDLGIDTEYLTQLQANQHPTQVGNYLYGVLATTPQGVA